MSDIIDQRDQGLLIDCFQTISVAKSLSILFSKDSRIHAFPIVCDKGAILGNGLLSFDQKLAVFQNPAKIFMGSNKE